jgi:guanine deaminase
LLGTFVHCSGRTKLEFIHDAAVAVDAGGKIAGIEKSSSDGSDVVAARDRLLTTLGWKKEEVDVHTAAPGQFYFPGFIGENPPFLFLFLFSLPLSSFPICVPSKRTASVC